VSSQTPLARLRYFGLKARARLHIAWGDHARAVQTFDAMLAEFPGDEFALASKAHLAAQLGRRDEAIALLTNLTAHQPGNAHHWFNLGFVLEQQRDLEGAETAFRRAIELSPQLDRAWYGLGLVLIQRRQFDEAVEALKRNTQLQPMSPFGWYQLARVHIDRHEPEEARKIIRHLQAFEPKVARQLERETGLSAALPR